MSSYEILVKIVNFVNNPHYVMYPQHYDTWKPNNELINEWRVLLESAKEVITFEEKKIKRKQELDLLR